MVTALVPRAREITTSFSDVVAFARTDVDVTQGQVHGLVGGDGAGKTTSSRVLLGLAVADRGTARGPGDAGRAGARGS
jgi:ABC-2 type transport system ATP-binding protein